jgi:hypothetical protein
MSGPHFHIPCFVMRDIWLRYEFREKARTFHGTELLEGVLLLDAPRQAAGITSKKGIAEAFNDRGIPTTRGAGRWYHPQVGRLLARMPAQRDMNGQSGAANEAASPSSGEVWSWDCGPESVVGHPTSTTPSSHVMYVTKFGPDWRHGRHELRKLMPLFLITYQSDGRLAGMAVVSAESEADARVHAVSGVGDTSLHQVHTLGPESDAAVPERLLGRVLSRSEATKLLHRIAHAVGQVRDE